MTTEMLTESIPSQLRKKLIFVSFGLPIARMIHEGALNPETINCEEFAEIIDSIGRKREYAIEIYIDRVDKEIALIEQCLSQMCFGSAVVLFFTLVEVKVNSLLRVLMRVRGFVQEKISETIKGTSIDVKLDVLLPLLGVQVGERFRNTVAQCKVIRNLVVHNKAMPEILMDTHNKESDLNIANNRAEKFFLENPIARLSQEIKDFYEHGLGQDTSLRLSQGLFEKFSVAD